MNHRSIVTRYINAGNKDNPAGFWGAFTAQIVRAVKLPSKFTITDVAVKHFGLMYFVVEVKENAEWPKGMDGFIAGVNIKLDKDAIYTDLNFGGGLKNLTFPIISTAGDIGRALSDAIDRNTKSLQEM